MPPHRNVLYVKPKQRKKPGVPANGQERCTLPGSEQELANLQAFKGRPVLDSGSVLPSNSPMWVFKRWSDDTGQLAQSHPPPQIPVRGSLNTRASIL